MERRIENGITIIHTTSAPSNCNGCQGISAYSGNRYRVEIQEKQDRYAIGIFNSIDDAIMARQVAEHKRKEGILKEWKSTIPHGNSEEAAMFWDAEFNRK